MGSRNPFPGSYNSKMLAILQEAFTATLADLKTTRCGDDEAMQRLLGRRLIDLADEGITDAAELRRLALKGLSLRTREPVGKVSRT
jgi:hypothetical protein